MINITPTIIEPTRTTRKMAKLTFGEYSRDKMVATITSFYRFQANMHSNTNAGCNFRYPPPTGWPEVTSELFSWYDETVVDLIRHLPYIDDEGLFILPDTNVLGHASPFSIEGKIERLTKSRLEGIGEQQATTESKETLVDDDDGYNSGSDDLEPFYPEYMLDLAAGGQYGSTILVDTRHNAIVWWEYGEGCRDIPNEISAKYPCDCWFNYSKESNELNPDPDQTGGDDIKESDEKDPGCDGSDDESSDDEEWDRFCDRYSQQWKISPACSPEDFFEMCKEQFRIMNWMPVLHDGSRGKVVQLYRHQEFEGQNLRMMQILRDAGWPGDGEAGGWDKASAEVAMIQMHREYQEEREARRRGVTRDTPLNEKWKDLVVREGK
ncbi:hypothetical protein ONS95_011823 [Cadophora gregata]|uniref:uncharacterized protein n=1 Tax=Cadophora gregata TaxID=51156 RepID=UPI0026DDC1C0|nr:uncharacterized protein ONS95_011823 [Cadophora gregata]KAK0117483.1 hypothetical protein ONS95_011823 [Cadophora gregata]KAK0122538.1 hypothetical protein ONS96_009580 [Cadophora gregata f. sp. sojae]